MCQFGGCKAQRSRWYKIPPDGFSQLVYSRAWGWKILLHQSMLTFPPPPPLPLSSYSQPRLSFHLPPILLFLVSFSSWLSLPSSPLINPASLSALLSSPLLINFPSFTPPLFLLSFLSPPPPPPLRFWPTLRRSPAKATTVRKPHNANDRGVCLA